MIFVIYKKIIIYLFKNNHIKRHTSYTRAPYCMTEIIKNPLNNYLLILRNLNWFSKFDKLCVLSTLKHNQLNITIHN